MTDINENWEARGSYLHKKASRALITAKVCTSCEQEKPLAEFSRYAYTTRQGVRSVRYDGRCKGCNAARRRDRYAEKGDMDRATSLAWKGRNRGHTIAYSRARQADPAHRANKAKAQRLRKARARSGQGDNASIRAIYAEAMRIEALIQCCPVFDLPELGKKMHVDHVVALANGGLHHEDNLQILPMGINLRKGTK